MFFFYAWTLIFSIYVYLDVSYMNRVTSTSIAKYNFFVLTENNRKHAMDNKINSHLDCVTYRF